MQHKEKVVKNCDHNIISLHHNNPPQKNIMFLKKYKSKIHYLNDSLQLHRENRPAVIYSDGSLEYYQYNQLHNENGPAIILPTGEIHYYQYNQLHNPNGPAIIYPDGSKEYYQYNQLHNPNGPALIYSNGEIHYYQYNQLHNPNGPAIINPDGSKEYYINDIEIQKEDLHKDPNYLKLKYNL